MGELINKESREGLQELKADFEGLTEWVSEWGQRLDERGEELYEQRRSFEERVEKIVETQRERSQYRTRCSECGESPAAEIMLRQQVGMVIFHRVQYETAMLCDSCARNATRKTHEKNAVLGWTSARSLVTNPFTFGYNARQRSKHKKTLKNQ